TQAQWKIARDNLHKTQWRSEQTLNVVNTFGVFIAVAFITQGALHGKFTTGDILLVLTLTQNLINSISPISRQINQASEIESAAERLVELLDVESEHGDKPDAVPLI